MILISAELWELALDADDVDDDPIVSVTGPDSDRVPATLAPPTDETAAGELVLTTLTRFGVVLEV